MKAELFPAVDAVGNVASLPIEVPFDALVRGERRNLMLVGDSRQVLQSLPSASIDCAVTSPPYWGHREYASGGIGQEATLSDYVGALLAITGEIQRVLKPSGSFWLNLGDTYRAKALQGVPWRVAFAMMDSQGWTLRNDVIWNKQKGSPDNSKDKLRNLHEHVFHFVKDPGKTYYDMDSVRNPPKQALLRAEGASVTATGVSGARYRVQIAQSQLTTQEKAQANKALDDMLAAVHRGELSDFRMVIRGVQRVTHSDSAKLSGRAKEVAQRGFYFLRYNPKGTKLADVWEILPEDSQGRSLHYAPFPEELCRVPILATCPANGVVLDPFAGTGTTLVAAARLGRKAIGIDISPAYATLVGERLRGHE